jgi:hypothetical protein
MNTSIFFALALISSIASGPSHPLMTRLTVRYHTPDLSEDARGARPKTLYLAGDRYARIEQPADSTTDSMNLIIVNEPNIWLIDVRNKTGNHSTNPGPDFSVHNPILGPDCPEELFDFEFGHEVDFLKQSGAKSLGSKQIGERECETKQFAAMNYLVNISVDAKKNVPIELKAFKDGKMQFTVEYLSYETDLPFDSSLFDPPKDVHLSEANR